MRPAVVLFGEPLPLKASEEATSAVHHADVLLVVGTSGTVNSATRYLEIAAAWGAHCVIINAEPWDPPHRDIADELIGPAEQILPALVADLEVGT